MPATGLDTNLWQALVRSAGFEAAQTRAALELILPRIEAVLSSAATAPTDFTLHDSEHSFRVAQKMAEIIPADVLERMAPYEVALLLLSAYLHDIGMTPNQSKVRRHWFALIAAPGSTETLLAPDERAGFQAWLDDYGDDIQIPLTSEQPTEEQLRLADRLVTHYARARHNDWSEEWVRANLAGLQLGSYEGWVEDLVSLCRSHHEGYDELRSARFDPRPAGAAGVVVHLRYLACALRVSDVLDVDPERTPDVVFAHRDIAAGSVLYWRKDHATWLSRNGPAMVLAARPQRASIEKAIRDTAAGIEAELQLVARLNREQPFGHCAFAGELPHAWEFPEVVEVQVAPSGGYVYIDGAFRPNTQKLLQLLSGTQLYRNPLVAVRELIQNAFDAVKEEIALQRLKAHNAGDSIALQHRVELRLEQRDGRYWLVCTDSGVGMTQAIIRDYLLVSGASRRHEILDLERRCRAAGFALGRTGEFGVGVLSYFMIADRFEIRTRRTNSKGGVSEATGWYFETDGVGSFGELRRDAACSQGTEVRLRLRRNEVSDAPAWFAGLRQYLRKVLCVVPCAFELTSPIAGCENMTIARGWVRSSDELTALAVSKLEPRSSGFGSPETPVDRLPRADQERLAGERVHYELLRREAAEAIRWHVRAGDLPGNLGSYRIHVPVFELPGGRCAAFMRIDASSTPKRAEPVGSGLLFAPKLSPRHSWHGMATHMSPAGSHPWLTWGLGGEIRFNEWRFYCEIDWTHRGAGEVTVDRGSLKIAAEAQSATAWVERQALKFEKELLEAAPSEFDAVNCNICRAVTRAQTTSPWTVTYRAEEAVEWASVQLPAISSAAFRYQLFPEGQLTLGDKIVAVIPALRRYTEAEHYDGLLWPGSHWAPDRVVALKDWRVRPVAVWEKARAFDPEANRAPRSARFPSQWRHVCCCLLETGRVWNASHPLVALADKASRAWWSEVGDKDPDPLTLRDALLGDKGRAAAWLSSVAAGQRPTQWQSLVERDPEFVRLIWNAVLGGAGGVRRNLSQDALAVWDSGPSSGEVRVFTPEGYEAADAGQFTKWLPRPPDSWIIEVPERSMESLRSHARSRRRRA